VEEEVSRTPLNKAELKLVEKIERLCCHILRGHGGRIQGAVMACLVARHLASYQEDKLREDMQSALYEAVEQLLPVYDGVIRQRRETH
jgi:hypothetical protein